MDHFVSIAEPIPGTPLAEEIADMSVGKGLLFLRNKLSFRRTPGSISS
jgi:hypothetical protein